MVQKPLLLIILAADEKFSVNAYWEQLLSLFCLQRQIRPLGG